MKKLVCILLAIAGYLAPSKAQTVWAPDGARWYQSFNFGYPNRGFKLYESMGDTLLNGLTAKKILVSDTVFNVSTQQFGITVVDTIFTYQSGDSVLFYFEDIQQFRVQMDFSLLPGDTLSIPLWNTFTCMDSMYSMKLDSIQTIVESGIPFRYFYFDPVYPLFFSGSGSGSDWVVYAERIGYLNTMGFTGECSVNESPHTAISCYSDSEVQVLPFIPNIIFPPCGYIDTDTTWSTVGLESANLLQITLYSNPVTESLLVGVESKDSGEMQIEIWSLIGTLVASWKIELFSEGETLITYPCTELPNGMYTLVMRGKSGQVSRSFVVNH